MFTSKKSFEPQWSEEPPREGTYRAVFKWGAPDGFKHPNHRLYAMLKEKFNMTDDDFREKRKTGDEPVVCDAPVRISQDQVGWFKNTIGAENVHADDFSRVKYASGKTLEEAMMLRNGINGDTADLVLHPRDKEDVKAIVDYCNTEKIPVYVYGGGSSVNFGVRCVKGGVVLVMGTYMNRILEFNETNGTITVEPGMMGPEYEQILNDAPERLGAKRSYTCGHFPQSFEYSSVGGWIVTLGSGQQSSYYGDMKDIVVSQEYVTPAGTIRTLNYPSTATGPKVSDIMIGSEGAYGVLVSATLKIFRYTPGTRKRFAFIFPSWESTVDAAREIFQGEFGTPSVFRISDPEETDVALKLYGVEGSPFDKIMDFKGYRPRERCLCIGHTEGERGYSKNVYANVKRICKQYGGMSLTGYPVKQWEHGRFADPYMREDLNDYGIMIDTLESGVSWDALHRLHQGVREYIKARPNTICMTHASHFYPQGTNLYFIFIGKMDELDQFRIFHRGVIDRIVAHGGSLSHHHGVGKMIGPWMDAHLGKEQMGVLRALKKHFDPNNIMNPGGSLGLDLADWEKRKAPGHRR